MKLDSVPPRFYDLRAVRCRTARDCAGRGWDSRLRAENPGPFAARLVTCRAALDQEEPMADFYDTPFSLDELRAAMEDTHHNWNWMFPPAWKDVVRSEINLFTSSSHIDFASDSARNREIWTVLGAVFAHALETGYRLGGGDPGGPDE